MPRRTYALPRYTRRRRKDRPDEAVVYLAGRRVTLGRWRSPESLLLL